MALIFIADGFAERVVISRNTGARFRDDYAAIDIATSYMKGLGQDVSDYDVGSCTTYDGYCVYFEIKPKLGESICGGDINVTLDKNEMLFKSSAASEALYCCQPPVVGFAP